MKTKPTIEATDNNMMKPTIDATGNNMTKLAVNTTISKGDETDNRRNE